MKLSQRLVFGATLLFAISSCTEPQFLTEQNSLITDDLSTAAMSLDDCATCTYVVPANQHLVDGAALALQPGSVICLDARNAYRNLLFRNLIGTSTNPIIIKSCGGIVTLNGTGLSFAMKTENSRFFQITGGEKHGEYGIQLEGGHIGLSLDRLSTNFEVDHLEVRNSGFAGIMAKTDPNCDPATWRSNFTMRNVVFHHNYVHDSGGEGFYVGNSFFSKGKSTPCGTQLPHEIHFLRLFNNKIENTGWDGIQVGAATRGARIYGNTIRNYGKKNLTSQNSGMQVGEGTGGLCYGNLIESGTGNGMTVMGLGDNIIHGNIIRNTGLIGIFCDERYTPGPGFKFINNTILNTGKDGIRIYAETLPDNAVINNVIVNPGTYDSYTYPRSSADAFIYKLSRTMAVKIENNYLQQSLSGDEFVNAEQGNFRPTLSSPLLDKGSDISTMGIATDYYKKARLRGVGVDIGAAESQY